MGQIGWKEVLIIQWSGGFSHKETMSPLQNFQLDSKNIVTCQAHPALVKRVQWSFHVFQFLVVYRGSLARVLSLPGAKVVCWRPHLAGT